MNKKETLALVIDASVAKAAGVVTHPTSRHCRDFLEALRAHREKGYQCVFSPALREEWQRHASKISVKWLTSMYAQRRVIDFMGSDDPRRSFDCASRQAAGDNTRRDKIANALEKDDHLVQAAIAHGRRIASLDETCRGYFHSCAPYRPELKSIAWANPDKPEEDCLAWLASGIPLEKRRMLGYQP